MKALLQRYRPRRKHAFRLLGALALALVVWVYVTNSENPETQFPFQGVVPSIQGLADGFVLTDSQGIPLASLETVSVVAYAPRAEHLSLNDFLVHIDMSAVSEAGTYEFPVQVDAPQVVRTWTVTPATITVRVERLRQTILPVEVVLLGEPGLPYIVGTPAIDPAQAMLQGPLSRMQMVESVQARVDLGGRTIGLTNAPVTLVAVDAAENEVRGVTVVPARATVTVPIVLQGGHIAVSVVPRVAGQPALGYYLRGIEVFPDMVTVFSGDPGTLAAVRYIETKPVDISGRSEDFSTTVELNLPANVALIHSSSQVTVTVRFGAIIPQLRVDIPVGLQGRAAGLEATWEPQWLSVVLQGPQEAMEGLSLNDIWAIVDISGLDAGEYDLSATLPTLPGVEVLPVYTPTVHVSLVRPATPTPTPTPTLTPTVTPVSPTPVITPPAPPLPPTATPRPAPPPTPGPSLTPTPLPSPTRRP